MNENQKLLYGVIRQLRHKKEHNLKDIKYKDKKLITEDDIMEKWR